MERAAFKIPLRPNPSTLPNVFPTILHELEAGPFPKQTEKLFSFYPFSTESAPYLINIAHMSQEDGLAEWFSAFADPLKPRADQTLEPSVDTQPFFISCRQSALNKTITVSPSQNCRGDWVPRSILSPPPMSETHAGMCCVEFYPQPEHRQDCWRSPPSGWRQSSDRLPRMSGSTCIHTRLWSEKHIW